MNRQIRVGDSKYDIFDYKFWPLDPISPQIPKFYYTNIAFSLETLLPSSHMHMCYKIFTPLGYCLRKTTFRTKIGGGWAREHQIKIWDPLFISETVEASDWKIGTQHEFRFTLPTTSFRTKLGRVWIRRVPLSSPLWCWCNCVFYVPSKTDGYPD